METAIIAVAIAAPVLIVAVVIFVAIRMEKKRTEALGVTAGQLGLQFQPETSKELAAKHDHLPLFSKGHGQRAKNHLFGEFQGLQLSLFDYRYTTGGGKSSQTWNQTILSVESGHINLPDFTCSPENIFAKIGSVFGYQDIDFDSHPEFSRRFLLRGSDEAAIQQLFGPSILEWFEGHAGVTAEASGNLFVFFRAQQRVKPELIPDFIKDGLSLFKELAGR